MICPKCGSNMVTSQSVTDSTTQTKTKGFGCIKACIGFLLFDFWGLLCGFCGMGKGKTRTRTSTKIINVCQNCGNRF